MKRTPRWVHAGRAAVVAFGLAAAPVPVAVASVLFGVGADYYAGAERQSTRDALLFAVADRKGIEGTAALSRYDHSVLGSGTAGTLGATAPITPVISAQVLGSRSFGEEGYRASLVQAGPVLGLGAGRTLGLLYTWSTNNVGFRSNGLTSELGWPVTPSLATYARGAFASVDGGGTSLQGAAGATWAVASRVLLLAELGLGRDAVALAQGGGQPVLGADHVSGAAVLIGMRYVIH